MNPSPFPSLIAFLFVTISFIAARSEPRSGNYLRIRSHHNRTAQSIDPFWSGVPADELEAKIHFYMQPTADSFYNDLQ